MPIHISVVIGMPTICQCVCAPSRNLGWWATSPAVVGALTSLGRLRRDLVSNELPRPDETLSALAAAAGGR